MAYTREELQQLNLGEKTTYVYSYNPSLLETFDTPPNFIRYSGKLEIVAPEFTSLCPKTGQPDFATMKISYSPAEKCVESKSLKLYLGSFRNHGAFHEECVAMICDDLVELLAPFWIVVTGEFTPRGGIPFWPTVRWSR